MSNDHDHDDDDIILTDEELAQMRPAAEVMSAEWLAAHRATRQRRGRGPQKAPTKQSITIRLDRDVLAAYRATGRGWQARVNATLKAHRPSQRRPTPALRRVARKP